MRRLLRLYMSESPLSRLQRLVDLIRGYFQGIARIEETAWSQIIEQFFRIALITWLLPSLLVVDNAALNAAYAMGITLLAEMVSVLYLLFKYQATEKSAYRKKRKKTSVIRWNLY